MIDVLRVFAACALELQHARGQQATELGVAWQGPTDPLAAAESVKEILEKVKTSDEHNRIFMVGHSNTIPSITNTLAGKDVFTKTFDESDYGNFVIVVLKKSGVSNVYTLRY